jgi:hypothetical protein
VSNRVRVRVRVRVSNRVMVRVRVKVRVSIGGELADATYRFVVFLPTSLGDRVSSSGGRVSSVGLKGVKA